jgi:hypothetical protein
VIVSSHLAKHGAARSRRWKTKLRQPAGRVRACTATRIKGASIHRNLSYGVASYRERCDPVEARTVPAVAVTAPIA